MQAVVPPANTPVSIPIPGDYVTVAGYLDRMFPVPFFLVILLTQASFLLNAREGAEGTKRLWRFWRSYIQLSRNVIPNTTYRTQTSNHTTVMARILQVNQDERRIPSTWLKDSCLLFISQKEFYSSQAARRDQNRIAQREFRLRKQQRVCILLLNYSLLINVHWARSVTLKPALKFCRAGRMKL